ncbi:hypothetical protein L596_030013 [Steinernema carpocapsae]|uniref:Uncharacterized protein n=1 Tax=Steinernema carpocapsae TaxID=34508 RepID=A0A4U5LRH1_STECR|nr:hypothetical protein L596_030013 [Steinernema carpocapsae]
MTEKEYAETSTQRDHVLYRTEGRSKSNPEKGLEKVRQVPIRILRRADSLDSASAVKPKERAQSPTDAAYDRSIRRLHQITKVPTLLKRNSLFYRQCDLCVAGIGRIGDPCPACQKIRTRSPTSRYDVPHVYVRREDETKNGGIWPSEKLRAVSERNVNDGYFLKNGDRRPTQRVRSLSPPKRSPDGVTNGEILGFRNLGQPTRYRTPDIARRQTVIWPADAGPAWKLREELSPNAAYRKSPVFRFGNPNLPEALYDYDVYAAEERRKAIERRKRKIAALIFCLLALALVVAAGSVLAALH